MKSFNSPALFSLLILPLLCLGVIGCKEDCPSPNCPGPDTVFGTTSLPEVENTLAVDFKGSTYVRVPGSADLQLNELDEFSVDAWVQPESHSQFSWVLSQAPSNSNVDLLFGFRNANARVIFDGIGNDLSGSISVQTGEWHHIATVYDGDSISLYVDGTLDGKRAVNPADSFGVADFIIGARESSGGGAVTEPFRGIIHEVRIWNQALTPEQVDSAAHTRVPDFTNAAGFWGSDAGLGFLARWSLNSGSSTDVRDLSGSGHDGVIQGANWVVRTNPFYQGD